MSELLGRAVLELTTDQAPLNKGMDTAEVRVKRGVDVMKGYIDALSDSWAREAAAATAAADKTVTAADRATAALVREAAAAHALGDELAEAAAKGELGSIGSRPGIGRGSGDRDITDRLAAALEDLPQREAAGSGGHVGGLGGVWGVRGPGHPGSLTNPLVVVLEAGKYAPMGSMAAALGDSNMADQQGNASPVASAIDLQALTDQVSQLTRQMEPAQRLADAGAQGIGTPAIGAPGAPQTTVQDPEGAMLLAQVVQGLEDLKDGLAQHPLSPRAQVPAAPARSGGRRPVMTPAPAIVSGPGGSSGGYEDALARQAAADAAVEGARRTYAHTLRPSSGATPEEQSAALAERLAAEQQAAAARAETKAAQAQTIAARGGGGRGGGGGGGGGDAGLLGMLGGHSGGGDGGKLLRTVMKGDGGKGGAFGLPKFGSVGSLAGFGLEHWLLSGLGIGASAASAVGGAGLLGAAGLTQGVVGGGADLLISHDTITQAEALNTNVQALDKAIAVYGKGSKQAAAAQYDLNQQWKELGGGAGKQSIVALDQNAQAVKKLFDTTSAGAREQAAAVDEQVLSLAKTYTPLVVDAAQRNLSMVNTGLRPLFSWLEGPQGIQIFHTLEDAFARDLPTSIHALDMGIEDFLRLMAAASGSTGGLAHDIDNFFTAKNQEGVASYDAEVQKLVGDLHLWTALLKVLAQDVGGIFKEDAGTAPDIVEELTNQLERLRAWEESAGGESQLSNLFAVHKKEIMALIGLLPDLVHGFGSFYMDVAPPLVSTVTSLAQAFGSLFGFLVRLSPATASLVGLAIAMHKLGVLGSSIKALAGALGLVSGAEAKNAGVASADATANRALAGSEVGVAEGAEDEEGSQALASRMAPSSMMAALSARGAKLGGASAEEVAAASGGEELTGTAALGAAALPALASGGLGLFAGGILQSQLGLRGGTAGTVGVGAVGGGIGFAIGGPLGAAIGAGIGGTLGPTVLHLLHGLFGGGEDYGKEFATKFGSGFDQYIPHAIDNALQKKLASQLDAAQQAANRVAVGPRGSSPHMAPGDHAAAAKDYAAAGITAAKTFDTAYATVKFPGGYSFATDAIMALNRMKPQMREAGAAQMLSYAQGLADKKQIPESAVKLVRGMIEDSFGPQLQSYLTAHGEGTDQALAATLKLRDSRSQLTQTLQSFRQQFAIYNADPHVTGATLVANTAIEMRSLKLQYATGVAGAGTALEQLRTQTAQVFSSMLNTVTTKQQALTSAIAQGSASAANAAASNFADYSSNVQAAMQAGVINSNTGLQDIAKALNSTLKAFGAAALPMPEAISWAAWNMHPTTVSDAGVGHHGLDGGGLLQIGKAGEKGRDSVPLNVAGIPVTVAPGEKVAVFNSNQEPIMNAGLALMGYAGLGGLFSQVKTPNYMAGGGMVVGASEFGGPGDPTTVGDSGAYGTDVEGSIARLLSGGSTFGELAPGSRWRVSAPSGKSILATVTDMGSGGGAVDGHPRAVDLWWQTANELGLPGSAGDWSGLLGLTPAGSGGGGGAGGLSQIPTPGVKGTGTIADLVRNSLGKAAAAANQYASSHAPSGSSGGGGAPGTVIAHGGKPAQIEAAMMMAAHQILGLPYIWGGGHASFSSAGYDCSGAVSYLLHAAGLLPSPLTTSGLANWGLPGPGKYITVADSIVPDHTMISFFDHFLESGGHTSAGPHWDSGWSQDFPIHRHPAGLAAGGLVGDFGEVSPGVLLAGAPFLANDPSFMAYAAAGGLSLSGSIPDSFKSNVKKPKPKHQPKPHGLAGVLGISGKDTDTQLINAALKKALSLDGLSVSGAGGSSDVGNISELISYWEGIWGLETLNYGSAPSDFVISTDPNTGLAVTPYIDQSSLGDAMSELQQLLGWQGKIVADLKLALQISQLLIPAIKKAIAKRQAEIAALKEKIASNMSGISTLQALVSHEKKSKTPDKKQIGAWTAQIDQLQAHNLSLGGNRNSIGSGGRLGSLTSELGSLEGDLSAVSSWPYSIAGGTGLGGDLGPAVVAYDTTAEQLLQLKPGTTQALTVAGSSAASSSDSEMVQLLQEQLTTEGEENAVMSGQIGALASAVSDLPPFGGSFATGGIVPGPVGAARTVIAHGGEPILPLGSSLGGDTHVHIDKRSDLHKLIDVRVEKGQRSTARKGSRRLPSAGGGLRPNRARQTPRRRPPR